VRNISTMHDLLEEGVPKSTLSLMTPITLNSERDVVRQGKDGMTYLFAFMSRAIKPSSRGVTFLLAAAAATPPNYPCVPDNKFVISISCHCY
jgi:hypothetical protein